MFHGVANELGTARKDYIVEVTLVTSHLPTASATDFESEL
jgi:hypothetical protein